MSEWGTVLKQAAGFTARIRGGMIRGMAILLGGTGLALSIMRGATLMWAFLCLVMAALVRTTRLALTGSVRWGRRLTALDSAALMLAPFAHQWAVESMGVYLVVVLTVLGAAVAPLALRIAAACLGAFPAGGPTAT